MLAVLPRHLDLPDRRRHHRPLPEVARDPAQLSDRGAPALHLRGDPAGDAPVLLRGREGRHAVQPRPARHRLPARQERARRPAIRHQLRRLCAGLRMDGPFDRAHAGEPRAAPHPDRRPGLHAALFGLDLQHLGHELRLAQRQCHPGVERRRQARRLLSRHRRRRLQPLSPRGRRRHRLGDRLGLLRRPQRRRHLLARDASPRAPRTRRSRWSS